MTSKERKARLRAEAKAWKRLAEWCVTHGDFLCNAIRAWADKEWHNFGRPFNAPWSAMAYRIECHAAIGFYNPDTEMDSRYPYPLADCTPNQHARVIFCLLMALECEEEARA